MPKLANMYFPNDKRADIFKPTIRWAGRWIDKRNICKRRYSNAKGKNLLEGLPQVQGFHCGLRKLLVEPAPRSRGSSRSTAAVRDSTTGKDGSTEARETPAPKMAITAGFR